MIDVKSSQTVKKIDRYRKGKEKLERVLTESTRNHGADNRNAVVEQAELEVEEAFADLLQNQSTDVSDVLEKSRIFIDEVLSDAELTTYQAKGLLSILDALTDLVSDMENRVISTINQ